MTTVHSVFDDRIFLKECRSLARTGYRVSLIGQHNTSESIDGVRIIPLSYSRERIKRFAVNIATTLLLAIREKAAVYHFHDPELIPVGLFLKLLMKKRVIYDVHEDYGRQFLHKEWIGGPGLRRYIAKIVNAIEQWSSRSFDMIICATSDIAQKFPKEKTIVVRNLALLSIIDSVEKEALSDNDSHIIIYAGALTAHRGILELIDAVEIVGGRAELWLLGEWDDPSFQRACEKRSGWKYTRYLGYKPVNEVYRYMKSAVIGAATLHPLPNYLTSLPVKVFEYMACSLPVIMSNFDYWEKIFDGAALYVNPQSPAEIAERINCLINRPKLRKAMAQAARSMVEASYSWEKEEIILTSAYKELLDRKEK